MYAWSGDVHRASIFLSPGFEKSRRKKRKIFQMLTINMSGSNASVAPALQLAGAAPVAAAVLVLFHAHAAAGANHSRRLCNQLFLYAVENIGVSVPPGVLRLPSRHVRWTTWRSSAGGPGRCSAPSWTCTLACRLVRPSPRRWPETSARTRGEGEPRWEHSLERSMERSTESGLASGKRRLPVQRVLLPRWRGAVDRGMLGGCQKPVLVGFCAPRRGRVVRLRSCPPSRGAHEPSALMLFSASIFSLFLTVAWPGQLRQ